VPLGTRGCIEERAWSARKKQGPVSGALLRLDFVRARHRPGAYDQRQGFLGGLGFWVFAYTSRLERLGLSQYSRGGASSICG